MKTSHIAKLFSIYKFVLVILILISSVYGSSAQNWAPVGAKWHFTKHTNMSSAFSYTTIEVEKDTMVLGKKCSKLIGNFDPCIWQSNIMYESNDSVYFYHTQNNDFSLLYDFGANPGDIWEINNITSSFGLGFPDTSRILVDSVDQILIDGEILRVLYTTQINMIESDYEFGGMIIEKIGAISFYPWLFSCDPVAGIIRCYEDDDIFYQRDSNIACEYSTVNTIDLEIENVKAYPNPVNDKLRITIDFPFDQKINFQMIDMSNKMVLHGTLGSTTIDVSSLLRGVYVFNLVDSSNEVILTTKILKL